MEPKPVVDNVDKAPIEILKAAIELHDIRDHVTNLKAREKELAALIAAHYDKHMPNRYETSSGETIGYGGINTGYARITHRRGRETVDIALLRSKLGDDAEEYISRYKGSTVISHIDARSIEQAITNRDIV